jgi:hypothetical protein
VHRTVVVPKSGGGFQRFFDGVHGPSLKMAIP